MANNSINLVGLDFESIKSNLKSYLQRSESPFKDVDFEGSNISNLVDVLAYNTYLNNYYLNVVASEMFLDSAQLRDSVVSHAKSLNYVPRSYRSTRATLNFNLTPDNGLQALIIPKGTSFTTKLNSNTYSFVTNENTSHVANNDTGIFSITLDVYEGSYFIDSYVFDSSIDNQRFLISNPTVDTNSITVDVIENSGANLYSYTLATSLLGLTDKSIKYFLQGAENNQYEIVFGDDVSGRKPKNGAVVVIQYRVCSGSLPNGARLFDIDGPIQGQANVSAIVASSPAYGGAEDETLSSIKFNAVRYYQNQERAVTSADYETILLTNFPEIDAASAFGGEEADPPVYGKVFVAVDTNSGEGATEFQKATYKEFLKTRSSISIDPVIIDPDYLFIDCNVNTEYNINVTSIKSSDIEAIIKSSISSFNTTYLGGFKKVVNYSALVGQLNNAHPSIYTIDLSISPWKRLLPTLNTDYSTTIDFGFALSNHLYISYDDFIRANIQAVYSTSFTYNGTTCTLQDDNNGNLGIYTTEGYEENTLLANVGTIDYLKGTLTISKFNISAFRNAFIKVYAVPVNKSIATTKNSLVDIRDSDITVTATAIRV